MTQITAVKHHIQKYILDLLSRTDTMRFSDLRPPGTDTNVCSYHLKTLLKLGLVKKSEYGYSLAVAGLACVDSQEAGQTTTQTHPSILIMLLIQNSDGDILLQRRSKQPYINAWTLPYGKLQLGDASVVDAGKRCAAEKLGLADQAMGHVGDCYIRVVSGDFHLSTTFVHVLKFNDDDIETSDDIIWTRPHKLRQFTLAPAVEDIISRGFFNDPFFFEEFESSWSA